MSTYKTPPLKSHRDFDSAIMWHENFQIGCRKLIGIKVHHSNKWLFLAKISLWQCKRPDASDNSMPVVKGRAQSVTQWIRRHVLKNVETSLALNAKQFSEKKKKKELLPISKYFIFEMHFFPFKRIDSSAKGGVDMILGYLLQGNYSLQQRQFWNFHKNLLPLFHWS